MAVIPTQLNSPVEPKVWDMVGAICETGDFLAKNRVLALADNDLMAQQIMREDVVDKVLKRDLPSLYNIRNATELERIFLYLCNVSSGIVSIEAITKELNGVSRTTVENYIQYLESANLIYQSWPVDMAGKKVLKARPKIYIADAAIRNAVLMDDSVLTDPVEMGKIVETAVYKHVAAFYYQYATSVGYFRGGKKGKEIDIVVDYPNTKNILIEVKYREGAPIADDDAIVAMVDANIQREELLPSEKAFAYKMKLAAMKRQAGRPKSNSGQNDQNLIGTVSRDVLAEQVGESSKQIQRYIRLTELIPELLDMVDNKKLQFTVAVDISYIDKEVQEWIYEYISDTGFIKPKQIAALRNQLNDGPINQIQMLSIFNNCVMAKKVSRSLTFSEKN
jgi:biotin operon repressor